MAILTNEVSYDKIVLIEKVIKDSEAVISFEELNKKVNKKISEKELKELLNRLESEGKIFIGSKGISWLQTDNKKLKEKLKDTVRVL